MEQNDLMSLKEDNNNDNKKKNIQFNVNLEQNCIFCAIYVVQPDLVKPCNHIVCDECFIRVSPEHNDNETFCDCGVKIDYIAEYDRGGMVYYITGS